LLIKYIKSVLWKVAKCMSYIEEARCLKVKRIKLKISWTVKSIYTRLGKQKKLLYLGEKKIII